MTQSSTDYVRGLVRLQAEAAANDFLLDLGGAAEDQLEPYVGAHAGSDEPGVRAIRPTELASH
jgi:hypothetical protein